MNLTKEKISEKLKVSGGHLLVSMAFGLAALLLIYLSWYPDVLAKGMRISSIVGILFVVDVLMGPLLTFVVYDASKKYIKYDLIVIFSLQIMALFIGLNSIFQGRPEWLVFVEDRFEIARYVDIDSEYKNHDSLKSSFWAPRWVAVPLMSTEQKDIVLSEVLKGFPDVAFRPNMYREAGDVWVDIRSRSMSMSELEKFNSPDSIRDAVRGGGDIRWLPLITPDGTYVVIVGLKKGDLKILDLKGG